MKNTSFTLSTLVNLKSLTLRGVDLHQTLVDAPLYILSTVNAPTLQTVTLVITHDSNITNTKLDDFLATKFNSLKSVVLECVDLGGLDLGNAKSELQSVFPQLYNRHLLTVRDHVKPYRY